MFGLPKNTELRKQLPKSLIYTKFMMNASEQAAFDEDIARMYMVNEIATRNVNLTATEKVQSFFVVQVLLKRKEFNIKNILKLQKLINQHLVFALQYEEETKLVVYFDSLVQSAWKQENEFVLPLAGLTLEDAWENIVRYIGSVQVKQGHTLAEQLELDGRIAKLQKELDKVKAKAWKEKQPLKKFELAKRMQELQKQIDAL